MYKIFLIASETEVSTINRVKNNTSGTINYTSGKLVLIYKLVKCFYSFLNDFILSVLKF